MPRISLDAALDRQLAVSKPEVRYTDMAIVLRRLTLDGDPRLLKPKTELITGDGTEWRIPQASYDHSLPVSTIDKRLASRYSTGTRLYLPSDLNNSIATLQSETIVSAGGVWDNLVSNWRKDASGNRAPSTKPLIVTVRESQVEVVRWWAIVLHQMRNGLPQAQQGALIFGDRRGGKTVIALWCVVSAGIDCPKIGNSSTITWLVSVNHPSRAELDREFKETFPAHWYKYQEQPSHTYTLVTGAKLTHRTSEDPEELRNGRVDLAVLNEAGRMPKLAFDNVLNALADKDGTALLTSNRPRRAKANYIVQLAKDAKADIATGVIPDIAFFQVDPKLNDAISSGAKTRIKRILERLDPDEAEEGDLLEVGEYCYAAAFDEQANVAPFPDTMPDITQQVTKMILGYSREWLITADFQERGGLCGVSWKILGALPDKWILWATRTYVVNDGNEDDLIDEFEETGINAGNCIGILDASAAWQNYKHNPGLDSFRYFKDRKYLIRGPQPKKTAQAAHGRNPSPKEVAVSRFKELLQEKRNNGLLRAMMISDDAEANPLVIDIKKCKAVKGKYGPIPGGQHAHLPDCAIYAAWAVLLVLRPGMARLRGAGSGGVGVGGFNGRMKRGK